MRVREWYGWHFPEMTKIVADNIAYAKCIKLMGTRDQAAVQDFSGLLEEEVEQRLKEAAIISMGTEVSGEDLVSPAKGGRRRWQPASASAASGACSAPTRAQVFPARSLLCDVLASCNMASCAPPAGQHPGPVRPGD